MRATAQTCCHRLFSSLMFGELFGFTLLLAAVLWWKRGWMAVGYLVLGYVLFSVCVVICGWLLHEPSNPDGSG